MAYFPDMNLNDALERLRSVLHRQHKALATEDSYVFWLRSYVRALNAMPDSLSSEQKLEHFLTDLACRRDLAASTQNQAFNAILFFYKDVLRQPLKNVEALRAKRPVHLRHAPSVSETQALLQTVRDRAGYPTNLIARLLYGCGLRVAEPLNLRIKDVNLEKRSLFIVGAKGGQDRVVALPNSLVSEIGQQIEFARAVWSRDKQNKIPLMLPHQLALKYPDYQFFWPWAWLFPSLHTCFHPRTRLEVRYRMHEANVQRASRRLDASWAFQFCRMNCVMDMPPIVWKTASIPALFSRPWAMLHWKPPWVICTRKASACGVRWKCCH